MDIKIKLTDDGIAAVMKSEGTLSVGDTLTLTGFTHTTAFNIEIRDREGVVMAMTDSPVCVLTAQDLTLLGFKVSMGVAITN